MHKSDKIHAHTIMMHSVQALYCNWDCHWDCLRILGLIDAEHHYTYTADREQEKIPFYGRYNICIWGILINVYPLTNTRTITQIINSAIFIHYKTSIHVRSEI